MPANAWLADVMRIVGAAELAAMGAFLFSGSVLIFVGYALLFSTETAMRRHVSLRRWFEAIFGVLFGGAAVAILASRA